MKSDLVKTLLSGLSSDVNHYGVLEKKLKQQYVLLLQRNSQELTVLNNELQQLMQQLQNRATERSQILTTLGLTSDNHGMTTLLKALPSPLAQTYQNLWSQLFNLTHSCQEINNQNGRLLAQQKQSVSTLLSPEQQFIYTPSN